MYNNRFHTKVITITVICLFMFNSVSSTAIDANIVPTSSNANLAVSSVFQPIIDENIPDATELVFDIIAGTRLFLAGHNHKDDPIHTVGKHIGL